MHRPSLKDIPFLRHHRHWRRLVSALIVLPILVASFFVGAVFTNWGERLLNFVIHH